MHDRAAVPPGTGRRRPDSRPASHGRSAVPFRRSIFLRLFLVMIAAAVGIVAIVTALFVTVVGGSMHRILEDPSERARIASAHGLFLTLTVVFVLLVIVVAHEVIRRSLGPLRVLHAGVERVSAGELSVVVPVTSRDELGALSAAFNAMAARVREMLAARDRLLRDVSHELRSPLTRMKVAFALLPDGEKKELLSADLAEMETMIGELLELERLRDGRGLELGRHDLAPILRSAAAAFEGAPPGVLLELPDGELAARVDPEKMRTVLRNLLENAVKYAFAESAPVRLSAARDGEAIVLRVRDDGPGIPEADRASLFEPFFRVDRSRSKKTGGYGIGLSICKRIVEAHGGTIALEESPGRGATFAVRLPAFR